MTLMSNGISLWASAILIRLYPDIFELMTGLLSMGVE